MTTPSTTIAASNVNTELGRASTSQLSLNDSSVRSLAGKASGQISYGDLRNKSFISFNPSPGPYSQFAIPSASMTITCNQIVVWTWTRDDTSRNSVSPASGSSTTSWTATVQQNGSGTASTDHTVNYTVNATYNGTVYGPWTISLTGGGLS